jgi:hypothetical protein
VHEQLGLGFDDFICLFVRHKICELVCQNTLHPPAFAVNPNDWHYG